MLNLNFYVFWILPLSKYFKTETRQWPAKVAVQGCYVRMRKHSAATGIGALLGAQIRCFYFCMNTIIFKYRADCLKSYANGFLLFYWNKVYRRSVES
jgi:hypothetical protein